MKKLLVVSHGSLAKGVISAVKVILGDSVDANYCCLEEGMGIEEFRELLEPIIDSISEADQIIVLADLMGGSPYNATLDMLRNKEILDKSIVISGVNLPLALNLLLAEGKISKEEIENISNYAKESINIFEVNLDSDLEEDI
jgi:mannose/fructose-specific phosphotransferase system component IIA